MKARQPACGLLCKQPRNTIRPSTNQYGEYDRMETDTRVGMKPAKAILCLLALGSICWGQTKPAKKFHSAPPPPHQSTAKSRDTVTARSHEPGPVQTKSVSSRQAELGRIEHQNTALLQSKTKSSGKTSGTAPRVHSEPAGHSSGMNFSYHPPRNQGTTSAARKH